MAQQIRQTRLQSAKNTLPNSPVKSRKKLRLTLVVLLLAFVAIGSALLYHHHTQQLAINKERAQFAQTEKDLESSVKKIISSLGNPDKLLSDNHCAFASQEFGRGQLGCSVQITLIYGTSGKDVGLARADSISAILKRDDSLNYVSSSSALNDIGDPSQVAVVLKDEGYRDTSTGLQCGVMYYYYTSRSQITGYPTIATVQPYIDLISLSCGGEARSQLYPLAD